MRSFVFVFFLVYGYIMRFGVIYISLVFIFRFDLSGWGYGNICVEWG